MNRLLGTVGGSRYRASQAPFQGRYLSALSRYPTSFSGRLARSGGMCLACLCVCVYVCVCVCLFVCLCVKGPHLEFLHFLVLFSIVFNLCKMAKS